jgi:hypothetical protein
MSVAGHVNDDICSICREKLWKSSYQDNIETSVSVLPCNHAFHEDCINQWFDIVRQCPYCRAPVVEKDPVKEALDMYASGRCPTNNYISWASDQANIRTWLRSQFRNMELDPAVISEMLEDPRFFSKNDILFGIEYGLFSDEDIAYILEQEYITDHDLIQATRIV